MVPVHTRTSVQLYSAKAPQASAAAVHSSTTAHGITTSRPGPIRPSLEVVIPRATLGCHAVTVRFLLRAVLFLG